MNIRRLAAARDGGAVQVLRVAAASLRPRPARRRGPLVSVVIATYNWSSVLRLAIESVRDQTYRDWEIVVVGDACTDDSEAVVASFADERIRWLNLPENSGGQSTPNNEGIAVARGRYIAYLGHDDVWLPQHLSRLVAAAERTGAGLAVASCLSGGPPGSNILWLSPASPYTPDVRVPPSSVMHRRDLVEEVGGWRHYRELVEAPDHEMVRRLAAGTGGAVWEPDLTVRKFNSALRPGSYRERRSDEQQAALSAIRRSRRLFVLGELLALVRLRLSGAVEQPPALRPPPAVVPPGWLVGEWRRIRGLEDDLRPTDEAQPR